VEHPAHADHAAVVRRVVVHAGLGRLAPGRHRITATTARGSYPEIAPVTNEKGEFSFTNLPAGEYTLRAARAGFKEQTLVVKVEEKKTARAEFVLRR